MDFICCKNRTLRNLLKQRNEMAYGNGAKLYTGRFLRARSRLSKTKLYGFPGLLVFDKNLAGFGKNGLHCEVSLALALPKDWFRGKTSRNLNYGLLDGWKLGVFDKDDSAQDQ